MSSLLSLWELAQEWIIKTVHSVSSKIEDNAMTSKVVSKVMLSGGILKSGTFIREYNIKKNLIGTSKGKIIKKLLKRADVLKKIR